MVWVFFSALLLLSLCLLCYDVHDANDTILKAYDAHDWLRRALSGPFFLDKSYDGLGRDYIYYASALSL